MHQFIDPINAREYHFAIRVLRSFFESRGFIEPHVQHRLLNLSACENPFNIMTYNFQGEVWALPQTGQVQLEYELLKNDRSVPGYFCETTSYRQEPDPEEGRHNMIFPMFEFEMPGSMDDLRNVEINLLKHAGFGSIDIFVFKSYQTMAQCYNVKELLSEHEATMYEEFGPVVFLENFPEYTSPFWNMKRDGNIAKKIDVILHGQETIGSAERSTNPDEMREHFYSISGGAYAKKLFAEFTKSRIEGELEEFLSLDFFPRCGGGIGMTRWIRALKLQGLMPFVS